MIFINKIRSFSVYLLILAFLISLAACRDSDDDKTSMPARYGDRGRTLAVSFAQSFPERYAGSEQEKSAGDWIINELKNLDYQPQVQGFTFVGKVPKTTHIKKYFIEIAGTDLNIPDRSLM